MEILYNSLKIFYELDSMKSILQKINEGSHGNDILLQTTLKTIDAVKEWHDLGTRGNKKSAYVKTFEDGIEKFIRESIIVMDYVESIIDKVIEEYKINVDPEADWSEIQDAFVKYVINGK